MGSARVERWPVRPAPTMGAGIGDPLKMSVNWAD
jgi:hypothetical protein